MAMISLEVENSIGLAFTYNEPSIWYEYVYDVCKEIKSINKEHKTVLVTNGYICEEPLRKLLPHVDALNIDLKGNDEYYKKLCFGALKDVENTIKIAKNIACHRKNLDPKVQIFLLYIIIKIPEINNAIYTNLVKESLFIFLCTILLTTIAITTNSIVIVEIFIISAFISPLNIFILNIIAFKVAHNAQSVALKLDLSLMFLVA